jgi:hypothetical protein
MTRSSLRGLATSLLLLPVVLPVVLWACGRGAALEASEQPITFPNSGSAEVQSIFIDGLRKLHCFEYPAAEAAFREAGQRDPAFALAAWGEALCHAHLVWGEEDVARGRAALARLGATPAEQLAKAGTPRERAWLKAAIDLFGPGERRARYAAYEAAMAALAQAHPDDVEAGAFHGLAILGTAMGVRDRDTYERAAAVLQPYFDKRPAHPGLAHYLVHCFDEPAAAERGLPAALALMKSAAGSPHALHMPSHIFLALGRWQDVVSANELSWQASGQTNYHALFWLQYAHLQLGQSGEAAARLQTIASQMQSSPKEGGRLYLALMRAAQLVDGGCAAEVAAVPANLGGLSILAELATHQADGYCAWRAGDGPALERARQRLAAVLPAGGDGADPAARHRMDLGHIALATLEALALDAAGRRADAAARLQEVAARDRAMPLDFGPPAPPKPATELYAELLHAQGDSTAAAAALETAGRRHPGRRAALELRRNLSPKGEAQGAR